MSDAATSQPAGRAPCPGATIVAFPVARRTATRGTASEPGRILLFTGVRYERMPEAEAERAPRRRTPRRAAPARRRQPS